MGSINITVRTGPDWRALFPYVVAGLVVLWSLGWLLKAALLAAVVYGLRWLYRWHLAAVTEAEALTARADLQHQQVMSGDERGVYGDAAEAMESFRAAQRPAGV